MSHTFVQSYYANRFDPNTFFPELIAIDSKNIFSAVPMYAIGINPIEIASTFTSTPLTAWKFLDRLELDLEDCFVQTIPNFTLMEEIRETFEASSTITFVGLTYLASEDQNFDVSGQLDYASNYSFGFPVEANIANEDCLSFRQKTFGLFDPADNVNTNFQTSSLSTINFMEATLAPTTLNIA